MKSSLRAVFVALALSLLACATAHGQDTNPRFGFGFHLLGSTAEGSIGPGVRFRVSAPITPDVSFAVGAGLTGYIFEGQDEASYALDPQVSAIVTLPISSTEGTYVMGGLGAYAPLGGRAPDGGPTFHIGMGRVWLLQESSLFFEVNPAILVGGEAADLLLPVRVGIIF